MERPKGVFTPDEPGALPLDQVLEQISKDDQEDWEYEYSTTETETFYLTVELSYPEFKGPPSKTPQHSRGGYYKNWAEQDTPHVSHKSAPESKQPAGDNSDNGKDDTAGEQDDQYDDTALDPALLAMSKGKEKATSPPPSEKQPKDAMDSQGQEPPEETEDIQILDLHTPNPLFSYRGRLFQGQWAEVIGSEAIFAHTSELPALRNLPGDISLLAASSSRIMTTETIPRPNIPEIDTLAPIKTEWNIRIPGGKDKTGERAEQASFLENLIALKMRRGDKDQVTVYATAGKGKDWDDRKAVDYKPRRKKIGEEQEEEKRRKKKQSIVRRAKGRPSLSTRLEGYPMGFGEGSSRHVELSTMTPTSWEQLDRGEDESGGSEEEEEEVEEEEEDEDEENNDGEDEEEDVTMTG